MATTRDTLKKWFRRGAYPTASQFAAWIDSFFHKDDKIPVTSVEGLTDTLNTKADVVIVDSIKKQQEKDSSRLDDMVTKDSIISGGYRPVHVIDLGTYKNGKFSLDGTSYWGDMQTTLYSYLDGGCGVLLQSRTQFDEPRVFAPTRIYRSGDTLFVIEFMVSATQLCEIRIDEDADVEGGESLFTQRLIETGSGGSGASGTLTAETYSDTNDYNEL